MTREIIGASAIALVALVVWLVWLSNRRLRARQEALLPAPALGNADTGTAGFYVATVFADKPLDRVWAHGLGGRGRAVIQVSAPGVVIDRSGEQGILIPRRELIAVGRASATIDKGVEKDGLIQLLWRLGDAEVITSLRIVDPAKRAALQAELDSAMEVAGE